MSEDKKFDVAIIGAGPGGYVCALRCAQHGLKVALIEKSAHLGGTCLNVGCIPSKALLHSSELFHQAGHAEDHGLVIEKVSLDLKRMMQRKDGVVDQLRKGIQTLVSKRKITVFNGTAAFADATAVEVTAEDDKVTTVHADNFVIATGSVPASLPSVEMDGKVVVSSTEALVFDKVPQRMIVVGGGAIGLEMGSVWARLGSDVTIVEFLPTIAAGADADISKLAGRIFKQQGMRIETATRVTGCSVKRGKATLTAEKDGESVEFEADKVLVAVGRKPFTDGLGLEKAGLKTDDKGRLPADHFQTPVKGIWAIGDVIAGPMLAHKAEEDGVHAADLIAGKKVALHPNGYDNVPNVIYTHPEIAMVGLTESSAKQRNIAVKVGKFPLVANGRALAQDCSEGIAKIIACAKTDRLLGAAVIAPGASEMIASIVGHMEYGGSAEDLGYTVHAHPTISEAIKEAALSVSKSAIHSL